MKSKIKEKVDDIGSQTVVNDNDGSHYMLIT